MLFRLSYSDVRCTYWVIATCAVQTELHWCVLNRLCNTQRVLCRLSYTLLSNTGACSFVNIFSHDVSNFHYIPVQVFIFGRHIQVCVLYRLSYCDVCCTDWATAICAVQTELQWCVLYRQSKNVQTSYIDVCGTDCATHNVCFVDRATRYWATPELAHSWIYLVMTCIIFITYRYRYLYLEGIYKYKTYVNGICFQSKTRSLMIFKTYTISCQMLCTTGNSSGGSSTLLALVSLSCDKFCH